MHKILKFIKFEHTLFSLPIILGGTLLAQEGLPPAGRLLLILIAATGARTASLALNRIIDRKIDARNPRTRDRELPGKVISIGEAYCVLGVGVAAYLFAAYLISSICLALSPVPLAWFIIYPYLKRVTYFAHFGVGVGLAMGPAGGWIAIRGRESLEDFLPALILAFFTFLWVSGFDLIYSTLDEEFDKKHGLRSIPSEFGSGMALKVSAALHFLAFMSLAVLAAMSHAAGQTLPFLAVCGILLYLEHKKVKHVDLAFFKINAFIGFVVLGLISAGIKNIT